MRVLALADRRPLVDPRRLAVEARVAAVIFLGDLDRGWIDPLVGLDVPLLGVHGNHDPPGLLSELGVTDLHLRLAQVGGLRFAGFEGCVRYRRTGEHQYTQQEAAKLVRKLRPADVLVSHCPPRGINDDPDDRAHTGFDALRDWVDRHRPRHLLHGHTHPLPGRVLRAHGPTRVHYVRDAAVLELP
jgi:Icc-related predicted phosphoesterase